MLHTASEAISLARKLETDSAEFYENMGRQFPGNAESFVSFARENRRNITQVEQVYRGVISDAIEGCFAFNMDPDAYGLGLGASPVTDPVEVVKRALGMESAVIRFYEDAAAQSKSLMADIPRVFILMAKKKDKRRQILTALINGAG